MIITYRKAAEKALKKMDKTFAIKFFDAFDLIADGKVSTLDITKLSGRDGFRLRIGKYRAIFTNDGVLLDIIDVGSRGDIYK